MATNEISSSPDRSQNPTGFDPASIPVPPLHGCQIRPDMTFAEAAAAFDEWRSCAPDQARYRSHGTLRDCRTKLKALSKFFGSLKLRDIHIGHIREYQKDRFSNGRGLWAHPAGADKINQEMGLQLRIMRPGNAFTSDLEKYYQTLQVDECEIPKALSQEEQERFLEVAGSNPDWHIVVVFGACGPHRFFFRRAPDAAPGRYQLATPDRCSEPQGRQKQVQAPRGASDRPSVYMGAQSATGTVLQACGQVARAVPVSCQSEPREFQRRVPHGTNRDPQAV